MSCLYVSVSNEISNELWLLTNGGSIISVISVCKLAMRSIVLTTLYHVDEERGEARQYAAAESNGGGRRLSESMKNQNQLY